MRRPSSMEYINSHTKRKWIPFVTGPASSCVFVRAYVLVHVCMCVCMFVATFCNLLFVSPSRSLVRFTSVNTYARPPTVTWKALGCGPAFSFSPSATVRAPQFPPWYLAVSLLFGKYLTVYTYRTEWVARLYLSPVTSTPAWREAVCVYVYVCVRTWYSENTGVFFLWF